MEFYSPNIDLKKTFGAEIEDVEYISELNKICENANISYQEAKFIPHNLLTNWNEIVEAELYGDEDSEDFNLDFCRDILFELENTNYLIRFNDHEIFLKVLKTIDEKFRSQTFIPTELKNEKKWWNCSVFKKGTTEYINSIEQEMFDKFKIKLELKNRIEKIKNYPQHRL